MSKSTMQLAVLTANRLSDGRVVFLDYAGVWVEGIDAATVARYPDEMRALEARGAHDVARNLVLDPYLVEVRAGKSGLEPVRFRERVRVSGPSIVDDVPGYVAPAAPAASPASPPPLPAKNGARQTERLVEAA
jgi:hypothetical protein